MRKIVAQVSRTVAIVSPVFEMLLKINTETLLLKAVHKKESSFVELPNGRLHYLRMGTGKRLLLCFHGYGNNAALFTAFESYLEREFTIISIDLPHHGRSEWDEKVLLETQDMVELVGQLTTTFGVQKISLLGYSMGGRVCLTIASLVPQYIDKILLIAPDGLVFNPFYYFVTRTFIGKNLFKSFLTRPGKYLNLIEWLHEKKWIDSSRYKFAMYYISSEKDRRFLLKVWPGMSKIVPDRRKLQAACKKYQFPVFIFMGVYDRIIPVPHAEKFKRSFRNVHLFILEKGHRVFDATTLPEMANCLIRETC